MGHWGQATLRTATLRTRLWGHATFRTGDFEDMRLWGQKFWTWQTLAKLSEIFQKLVKNVQKCTFPNPAPEGRPETLQMTYIPKFWQQISNKICTFPKQKPSKLHTFSNPAPEGRPETLQITYIPKVLASYIQYFLIFLDFFANLVNFWKFVLKVAFWCDFEDRIFGPKIPYNICPQSRLSSKSRPQSRVLNVARPHCPIV